MARNERLTCKELIEPRLAVLGWSRQEQPSIGSVRANHRRALLREQSYSASAPQTVAQIAARKMPQPVARLAQNHPSRLLLALPETLQSSLPSRKQIAAELAG